MTFSLTENHFSGKTYFYTIRPRLRVHRFVEVAKVHGEHGQELWGYIN